MYVSALSSSVKGSCLLSFIFPPVHSALAALSGDMRQIKLGLYQLRGESSISTCPQLHILSRCCCININNISSQGVCQAPSASATRASIRAFSTHHGSTLLPKIPPL